MTVATAVDGLPRQVTRWAMRRHVSPAAFAWHALACAICAAAWFSAGTRLGMLAGAVAICASRLLLHLGRQVAAVAEPATDTVAAAAGADGWLAAGSAAAGEFAVYAGLAVGAAAEHLPGGWQLAAGAAMMLAFRQLAWLCHGPAPADGSQPGPPGAAQSAPPGAAQSAPPGAAQSAPPGAAQSARPGATRPGLAGRGEAAGARAANGKLADSRQADPSQPRPHQAGARPAGLGTATGSPVQAGPGGAASTAARLGSWLLSVTAGGRALLIGVTALAWGPQVSLAALLGLGAAGWAWSLARQFRPRADGPDGPGDPDGPARQGLAECRGDGPVARRAGGLARGQLLPLPPALAGLAATVLLAALGLRGLPMEVVLAPVAALLLAAAGTGHPHDGRLDWLVPPVLLTGQYVYLAALGSAAGVPGALTYALLCMIALLHLAAAYRARQRQPPGPPVPAGLGWDGRILVAACSTLLGLTVFAYLFLTAYLGWLLGRILLAGLGLSARYAVGEGERR